ncbi:hypothetical protein LX36DRAFT_709110 [Colletotrichum falcatum]|nr:hypothetical protein LX36DRAFT_709110 [Colletotrichum falcatum]
MAPRLDKMILDALEEVANKARKPIDEVLRATQIIIVNNIVKEEPAVEEEAFAQVAPPAATAEIVTNMADKTVIKAASKTATEKSAPSTTKASETIASACALFRSPLHPLISNFFV